jgi:hypothetical protein
VLIGILSSCAIAASGCSGGGNPAPVPVKVAAGTFAIHAVTSNYAIVTDLGKQVIEAVNLGNGETEIIASAMASSPIPFVTTAPNAVWPFSGTILLAQPTGQNTGRLTAWRPGGGAQLLSNNARVDPLFGYGYASLSWDGQRVAYWDHVDANADALTINTLDNGAPRVLATTAANQGGMISLTDYTGYSILVTSYRDSTSGTTQVVGFNTSSGAHWVLQDNAAPSFVANRYGGSAVVFAASTGQANMVSLDGARRFAFDADNSNGNLGTFMGDFFYKTAAGALKRIGEDGQSRILVPLGVGGVLWGQGHSIAYFNKMDSASGNSDLSLVNIDKASTPVVLSSDVTAKLSGFSQDAQHVFFYSGIDANRQVGTFNVMSVAGGRPRNLSSANGSRVFGDVEVLDEVVFNDEYVSAATSAQGRASLKLAFPTSNVPTTLLVSNADASFAVSADLMPLLVYTVDSDRTKAGLYTLAIPY